MAEAKKNQRKVDQHIQKKDERGKKKDQKLKVDFMSDLVKAMQTMETE